ncbi:hypothetical protein L198_01694 [Cryptococcus wingfieldii CBS 7118]|uniref:Uncharacterized protein n=1 Tax=Cryptococcus wingfieldii CBS 7118 TaxID=1295528 RepID=A0A1E3K2M8_9TREE|nr:hypothetical protein L198_01694 [Cryptococcus wingfieldii CBS 7118]ODO06462.1 hypothetical protein L198_01694 [Cryptococcus wingfieldii CBS 7118]
MTTEPSSTTYGARASSSLSSISSDERGSQKPAKVAGKKHAREASPEDKPSEGTKAKKPRASTASSKSKAPAKPKAASKSTSKGVKPANGIAKPSANKANGILDGDSDLSGLESDSTPTEKSVAKPKPVKGLKASASKQKAPAKGTQAGGKVETKKAAAGKDKKVPPATKKKVEPKPKAERKPKVEPTPPIFEKIATRLSFDDGEQRMALRELLWRFRYVLSIPDRSLPALDDFDRPITEANVRLFSGALLDMIKDEYDAKKSDDNEDILEDLFNFREELRYYADLVRFAAIFNLLSEPLNLRLPVAPIDRRAQNDEAGLRNLFDLDENSPAPAWTTGFAAPSRRGASKVPEPAEVVKMLLSLAERALTTPKMRGNIENFTVETKARREHGNTTKKEVNAWEERKKKLSEERIKCKTAGETKANTTRTNKEFQQHKLRIAQANVNLRSELHLACLRFESLGTDLDGRIYYALSHRPVTDDTRPPVGWGTGLIVWGSAIEGRVSEEDNLPSSVRRWTHFGRAKEVKELHTWLKWKFDRKTEEIKKGKGKGSSINSKLEASSLAAVPASPTRGNQATAEDDASSASSGLTPPPVSSTEEMFALVHPDDYEPSQEALQEWSKDLLGKVADVGEWLEVLEWKGLGEQ